MRYTFPVIIAIALSAGTLMAQDGTIAAYFTDDGITYSRFIDYAAFTYDAHIVIYVEDDVYGAAYSLDFDGTGLNLIDETYPEGSFHVGDMLSGVEVGLNNPVSGYGGQPVFVGTATFFNNIYPNVPDVTFEIEPAQIYQTPVYSDGAVLQPLSGLASAIGNHAGVVESDEGTTWGEVKALFR
jgi:hypothetical protein